MNIIRKVVLKSQNKKQLSRSYELADDWSDHKHRDKIQDGVTFNLKYLGSTLVEELEEEGASYGDRISATAVNTVVTMAKVSKKKLKKVSITISPRGIVVTDTSDQSVMTDLDIYRICFCTADREHGRVFAFIARNKDNETMECRAFLCRKRKIAQGVTLAVAESFRMAKEVCDLEEERMKVTRQPKGSRMVKLLEDLSPVELHDSSRFDFKVQSQAMPIGSDDIDAWCFTEPSGISKESRIRSNQQDSVYKSLPAPPYEGNLIAL